MATVRHLLLAVPSWSGRNSDRQGKLVYGTNSPSPHGRVGTVTVMSILPHLAASRRSLMVGSEPLNRKGVCGGPRIAVPSWSGRNFWEHYRYLQEVLGSPSPHGRVGTTDALESASRIALSPSPHGRVGTTCGG